MSFIADPLVHRIIGCAIAVHRALGPGLLESTYLRCLCAELRAAGIPFESEVTVPLVYRDIHIERAYRIDLLVDGRLVVEVKSCATVLAIHKAQVRTYVRLCRAAQGLILNFNEGRVTDGVKNVMLREALEQAVPHARRRGVGTTRQSGTDAAERQVGARFIHVRNMKTEDMKALKGALLGRASDHAAGLVAAIAVA